MKRLKEEKELRKIVCLPIDVDDSLNDRVADARLAGRLITALVAAVRADCISIYYDWASRPPGCAGITFPDAVRGNRRWRETATIRKGGK